MEVNLKVNCWDIKIFCQAHIKMPKRQVFFGFHSGQLRCGSMIHITRCKKVKYKYYVKIKNKKKLETYRYKTARTIGGRYGGCRVSHNFFNRIRRDKICQDHNKR